MSDAFLAAATIRAADAATIRAADAATIRAADAASTRAVLSGSAAARALPRTHAALMASVADGSCLGMQFSCHFNETELHICVGQAAPRKMMTEALLMNWQSTAKPVAAVAIALLIDRGTCSLTASVAEYIPEFGTKGKAAVTVKHLLTHTAGIPFCDLHLLSSTNPLPWSEMIAAICDADLECIAAGTRTPTLVPALIDQRSGPSCGSCARVAGRLSSHLRVVPPRRDCAARRRPPV